MDVNTALVILIVGALAGVISGLVAKSKGRGFRLIVHIIVGIIGAFHGRLIFHLIEVHAHGAVGHILFAAVGALLFLFPLRYIRPT